MTELQKNTIELLKEGLSPSQVAKKLNRNISSISSVIKRFNIIEYKKLNENKCNHHYFDKIDDQNKAYLLGFFVADGWITTGNRLGINIQSQDDYILKEYQKFTGTNIFNRNRTTSLIKRQDSSNIRWNSKYMISTFKTLNIIQNKTYHTDFEFPFEKMSSKFIRHFIRGFIDGDGCFESNKGVFTITLVNTSLKFMQQLGNEFEKITEGIKSTIRKRNGKTVDYYSLRFNFLRTNKPEKVLQIYNYLYKDSNLFLTRKKDKIESYLKYRGKL